MTAEKENGPLESGPLSSKRDLARKVRDAEQQADRGLFRIELPREIDFAAPREAAGQLGPFHPEASAEHDVGIAGAGPRTTGIERTAHHREKGADEHHRCGSCGRQVEHPAYSERVVRRRGAAVKAGI